MDVPVLMVCSMVLIIYEFMRVYHNMHTESITPFVSTYYIILVGVSIASLRTRESFYSIIVITMLVPLIVAYSVMLGAMIILNTFISFAWGIVATMFLIVSHVIVVMAHARLIGFRLEFFRKN
jgi:hypothetical protein